jgi:hypothetical protein
LVSLLGINPEKGSCWRHLQYHHSPVALLPPGDLEPSTGESRRSHKLRIGRYNQHFVDALAFDENPVEYLMNKFPEAGLKPEGMRAMLGKFGLSGHHHLTPIVKLSGEAGGAPHLTSLELVLPWTWNHLLGLTAVVPQLNPKLVYYDSRLRVCSRPCM